MVIDKYNQLLCSLYNPKNILNQDNRLYVRTNLLDLVDIFKFLF